VNSLPDTLRTAALTDARLLAWLAATVGASAALQLAQRFADVADLAAADQVQLAAAAGPHAARRAEQLRAGPQLPDLSDGSTLVGYFDDLFPSVWRQMPAPPAAVWVRGRLDLLGQLAAGVAIVGTRQPSPLGTAAARRAARAAVAAGLPVISGLAAGVDAAAHQACLEQGGQTIAVLGSGVNAPTPAQNRPLAAQILVAGGALVSEQPPGTRPSAATLIARNRLVAAAAGTVCAECGTPSGTLHTVRYALQAGRPLIVPRPPDGWPAAAGNAALLDPDTDIRRLLTAPRWLASQLADRWPAAVAVADGTELDRAVHQLAVSPAAG